MRLNEEREGAGWRPRQEEPLWTRWLDAFLAVIAAPTCPVCGILLDRPGRSPICDGCWSAVLAFSPPVCDGCGLPLSLWRQRHPLTDRCARCRRAARVVDRARAVGDYDGALRGIIHALKYEGLRRVAGPLGRLLRNHADGLLADADVAVPVPLHRSRERQRGFNQSMALASALGLPVRPALRRTRATPSQATLPASRRDANVRGAFAPSRHVADVRGRIVVLVDDVCTTGATLDACARVLKTAGAREVRAVTAARVVPKRR